jgi:hypothetical protein
LNLITDLKNIIFLNLFNKLADLKSTFNGGNKKNIYKSGILKEFFAG